MATLLEDLTDIEEKAQGLVENKVANFAYTQEAYDNDMVDGVSEYNVNNAQNIPTAEAETLDVNPTVLNKGYRSQASSITRMLMNHFLGRISYNLNKSVDLFKKGFLGIKNALGKPNGIATLDENGYLNGEQVKPVITNEKLKEFLLSGKEPSFKELNRYDSSEKFEFFAHSINDEEDILFEFTNTYIEVYSYNGRLQSIARRVFNSRSINHLCSYQHYEIFLAKRAIGSTQDYFIQFNYNTNQLTFATIEPGFATSATFNKAIGKWEYVKIVQALSGVSSSKVNNPISLYTVELDTFEQNETTFYLPLHPASGGDTVWIYLSANLVVSASTGAPGTSKGIYVYDRYNLTNPESLPSKPLIDINKLPGGSVYDMKVIEQGFRIVFKARGAGSILIVDNGNMFIIPTEENSTSITNYEEYLLLDEYITTGVYIGRVYKYSLLCTSLALDVVALLKLMIDSIFYNERHNYFIDVENPERITYLTTSKVPISIKKSDKRVYCLCKEDDEVTLTFNEITNALD